MKILTKNEIENLNYTDFIAFIKEINRCPGGKDSIRKVLLNSFVNKDSKVLEIGSNTGFTSLEVAHVAKCKVSGIDISKSCVTESKDRLDLDTPEIKELVDFRLGSAYEIPFDNETFDLVITGGATSFMDEKLKAINEYKRVVKTWGFISSTQLFYNSAPPQNVLDNVTKAIGVKINPWTDQDWLNVFKNAETGLELYYFEKNELQSRSTEVINEYMEYFLNKPHLKGYDPITKKAIENKWRYYIDIFNENHKYLGYFTALFRKPAYQEEPELFIKK